MVRLVVYLSMKPEEGGKFQYSLSMLEALSAINNNKYSVTAMYHDVNWKKYIPDYINKVKVNTNNSIYRIIRKVIGFLPSNYNFWRAIGKYFHPLHKILYKMKPHLIFYPGGDSLIYEVKLPGVIPVFDLMHQYEVDFQEVAEQKIYREREFSYKNICKYAESIFVDSEVGKQHLLECYKVKENKIYILPYIAPKYVRDVDKKVDVVKKYNLPGRYVFYPAQFWKHKNHEGLLYAISLLQKQNIIVNAVFVGSDKNAGDNVEKLTYELDLYEQIYTLNYVSNEDLVALYQKAIALVMPTFFGPTNIPQLEAFALGCPVITSNIYGMPEQVGDAALLVNPADIYDIAEKIKLLWKNEKTRQELIRKGYKKDMEWNQDQYRLKLVSIIENVLN